MGALLSSQSDENTSRSAIDHIPVELQLACLARVPYKDLREGVTCTCKTWRSLVASDAFVKMRAASGFSEWAVFAGAISETANCYLITASGTYLTAPRPPVRSVITERLTGTSGDVVALLLPNDGPPDAPSEGGTMRAHVYDPRRNRWSPIAPLDREFEGQAYSGFADHAGVGSVGSKLYVLGGGFDGSDEALMAFDAYDVTTGDWSELPYLPFDGIYTAAIEVDGKLWCYASQGIEGEIWIYDPETGLWTEGPDLPHELFGIDQAGVNHCNAFVREGRFCVLAKFLGGEYVDAFRGEGNYSYRTFAWDPTREEWDENPFPPPPECASRCSCIDDHLISFGSEPVGGVNFHNPINLQNWQQGRTSRLYVLGPRATEWAEWRLPADARTLGTRIAAVRLG